MSDVCSPCSPTFLACPRWLELHGYAGAKMGLDRSIAFFEVTDGRDKLAKCFQNGCKALAWHLAKTNPARAMALTAVATKLSEYRSVIKFFKWLKNIRDIRDLTWDDKIGDSVECCANIGDIFYRGFDNLQWLGLRNVVPYDPDKAEDMSDFFQFWGYLAQFILVRLMRTPPPLPTPHSLLHSAAPAGLA